MPIVNEFGIISRTAAPSVLPYKDFLLLSYQPLNFKEKKYGMEKEKRCVCIDQDRQKRKARHVLHENIIMQRAYYATEKRTA